MVNKNSNMVFFRISGIFALIVVIGFFMISCDNSTDTDISGINTNNWGEWTPTELAGTEERKTSDGLHIEQRVTGTGRFNFALINGAAAYSVSKGSDVVGVVRIPNYYRPSDEVAFQPVTSVGSFDNCTSLTGIIVPAGLTSIGSFSGCIALTGIIIPAGVTSIDSGAFYYCTSLATIIIPDGVTSIGQQAFANCTNLTSITIPATVTAIEVGAFNNTAWFNNQPDGLVYAGKIRLYS